MAAKHWITLATIAILVVGVVGFHVHVGMGAFAAAVVLTLAKVTDEKQAILALPWSVIVMVCGVTVLTALLEKTGGIDLFTTILARFATHRSVTGLIALVTGLVSVYSSTSGVVLPAFLPSVPAARRQARRQQSARDRLVDPDWRPPRRRLAPVDHRGPMHRLRTGLGRPPAPVQPGARLGTVDGVRGGDGVLPGVRKMVK